MAENIHGVLAFGNWGWQEWLLLLALALLIFGGKKLPELARSIGKSLNAFKKGIHEAEDVKDELEEDVNKVKDEIAKEVTDTKSQDSEPKG